MAKNDKGTFYLGRIIKRGLVKEPGKLFNALQNPINLSKRNKAWTFTNVQIFETSSRHYAFGRLSKFEPEAHITVVDTEEKKEILQREQNLKVASSPFIYIPKYSGIAFMRVPTQIEPRIFIRRFPEIIERTFGDFFVGCEVDPVTDLRTFGIKLSALQGIYKLKATISPPNPLFGHLWQSLKEYLEHRQTEKMVIQEQSSPDIPLNTELSKHIDGIVLQTLEKKYLPQNVQIGDASILMAADGYGTGLIEGKKDDRIVTIRTSETIQNFLFDKNPEPDDLYDKTVRIFESINEQRHMKH